jgi:uncharacterized protein (DUF169 family)
VVPFEKIAGDLTDTLHLDMPPIGVAFAEDAPKGVEMFGGTVPGGCRFWQEAMNRVFATVPRDHELCGVGVYTHRLESREQTRTELHEALRTFAELGYVRPEDIPFIPVLNRESKVVIYGPLASIPVMPDVVLLFVRAEQALILSEASQQLENGFPVAMGRPACAIIPQAVNTGRTALSLGCCGARAYLDALTTEVALYGIPGSKLEVLSERIGVLAKANATLALFHSVRRKDIEAGMRPKFAQSLSAVPAPKTDQRTR